MRLKWFNVMLGILALAAPGPAFAARAGLQFQVDGLGVGPVGKYPSKGNLAASAYFSQGPGPGFMVSATMGLTQHFVLGVRSGLYQNQKEDELPILFPGAIIHRKLTSIPVVGIVQYRGALPLWKLGMYAETGAGITSHTAKLEVNVSDPPVVVTFYQQDLTILGGAGLSYPALKGLDVVLSGDYYQALARNGDLWRHGDDPKAIVVALGLRFPRY